MTDFVQDVPVAAPVSTTPVPFRDAQGVYTVPPQDVQAELARGAAPLTGEEWQAHQDELARAAQEAQLQKDHGDLTGQLVAAGSKAVEAIPIAGPAIYNITPEAIKKQIRDAQTANPVAGGFGTAGSIGIQMLGGTGEAKAAQIAEGALARAAGEGAAAIEGRAAAGLSNAVTDGATAARAAQAGVPQMVANTIGAPAAMLSKVGAKVGEAVQKAIGDGATNAATRLATKAVVLGAQGATEGVLYGANDYLTETALSKDPEYDGTKLAHSLGAGVLFGGVLGGLGAVGEHALTEYVTPAAEKLSGRLGLRSFLGGRDSGAIKALGRVGGAEEVGNVAMRDGLIKAGRSVDELLPGVVAKDKELAAKVGATRDMADALGAEGISKAEVLRPFEEEIDRLGKDYTASKGEINTIVEMRNKLAAQLGIDAESASRAIPAPNYDEIRDRVAQQFLERADILHGIPPSEAVRAPRRGTYQADSVLDPALFSHSIQPTEAVHAARTPELRAMDGNRVVVGAAALEHMADPAARAAGVIGRGTYQADNVLDPALFSRASVTPTAAGLDEATRVAVEKAEAVHFKQVRDAQQKVIDAADNARANAVEAFQKGHGDYVKYADLAGIRQQLDGEVNWRATSAVENKRQEAFKNIRGKLEDSLEKGLDRADKVFTGAELANYRADKLHFRQIRTLKEIAEKAALARQNNVLGLGATIVGTGAMHLYAGAAGGALGLAAAIGAKLVKDRGMSTAAVLADKIHTLTAIGKATGSFDRQIARGADGFLDGRVPKGFAAPEHPYRSFKDKAEAVLAAERDPQGHVAHLTNMSAGIAQHAPRTAAAFVDHGVRVAQFLASVLPRERPANPLQPNGPKIEPSKHEQFVYGKVFDAVAHPPLVLAEAAKGTLVPQQVAAVAATNPKALMHMDRVLMAEVSKDRETAPTRKLLALSMLSQGKNAAPILQQQNVVMLQATWAPEKGGPSSGAGHEKGTPKAARLSIAKNSSLDPGRLTR